MITLQKHKPQEKARALKNAVIGIDGIRQNPKGTRIEYHMGDWVDNIGQTEVGKMAMELYKLGLVDPVQITLPGGMHSYIVVMR